MTDILFLPILSKCGLVGDVEAAPAFRQISGSRIS
jgi:hypothetical protein